MDEWSEGLFVASYGGVELDILDTGDELGRAVALHSYPGRDGGAAEDLGAEPRETRCAVVFFPHLREQNHLERLAAFLTLLHDGEAHPFTHPLTGTYRARPRDIRMSARAAERDMVVVSVTFVEDGESAAFELVTEASVDTAVEDVELTAAELDGQLDEQGLASGVGEQAVGGALSWADGDLSPTQLNLELSRLASRIDDEALRLELALNVERQPILQNLRRLRQNLRNVAERVAADGPQLVEYTVRVGAPLVAIAQELYGGEAGIARAEELLAVNAIRDPMLVPAGTVLTVPERS